MIKNILIVIFLVGICFVGWKFWTETPKALSDDPIERATQDSVSGYSLEGTVYEIAGGVYTIQTPILENGSVTYKQFNAALNANAEVYELKNATSTLIAAESVAEGYIKVGDKVAIYGKGNPFTATIIMVNKVEILR